MKDSGRGALADGFRHVALFYAGADEFLEGTTSFICGGLEADEPILAVLSAAKIEALRSELNGDADRVLFADMAEVGHNPARIIPAWRDFVDAHAAPGRRLRGIGEPMWAERSPAELVECQRHESLLNLAFADTPGFYLLCPYDADALDPTVLAEARRSHPRLVQERVERESKDYRGLEEASAPLADPLPEPPMQPDWRVFQAATLGALRRFVAGHALRAGFDARTTEDPVLAANEVAANSVLHGGGWGILRIWREGDALICELRDTGRIDRPLAGRERPAPGQAGQGGLWLVNQLCDLAQVRSFDHGSAVRLHMRRG